TLTVSAAPPTPTLSLHDALPIYQALHRRRLERRVGIEARAIGEGQLLGLHEQVHVLGRTERDLREVVTLEDVEHLQRGDALAVRSEEHTSELQSRENLVCLLLLE